jgi:hypothetical protein
LQNEENDVEDEACNVQAEREGVLRYGCHVDNIFFAHLGHELFELVD